MVIIKIAAIKPINILGNKNQAPILFITQLIKGLYSIAFPLPIAICVAIPSKVLNKKMNIPTI